MKKLLSLMLIAVMVASLFPAIISAEESAITLELKRDMTTNGIYLRANMAHNQQTMIIAQYRDNELEWVNVTPVDNGEGYHCDTAICTSYLPTDTFKGFLWDSLSSATPAVNSIKATAKAIEAPELWLDAADVATVTAENGLVSNWADKSGNGRDVYQETEANMPVYKEGEYVHTNSTKTISFLENRKPLLMDNPYTVFMMAEIDEGVTPNGQFITEGSSTSNTPAYCITSSVVQVRIKSGSGTQISFPENYWKSGAQLHVIKDTNSDVGATVYRNDASVTMSSGSYTNKTGLVDIFAIGARRHYKDSKNPLYAQYPANCKFRELIIYDGVLSEERTYEIKEYLLNKWGLEPEIPDVDVESPTGLTPDAYTAVAIDPDSTVDKQYAYYYVPRAALDETKGPVPLVVGLHSWSATYEDRSYANIGGFALEKGWAMIHPNFRGANDDPDAGASELAVDDVVRAVEFMKANANIDESRIYLVGASGGGHMALSVASRRPEIWAAVSAWVPITDLAEWYNFSKSKGSKYYSMVAKCCGGAPGDSEAVDAQYLLRSPINHLHNAVNIPIDINAGIHDGHTGSVPIDHTLKAFNVLANASGNTDKMLTDEQIAYMVENETIPESIENVAVDKASEGRSYDVLFRRTAGNTRVTIFEGGHTGEFKAAYNFFEDKVKQ